MVIKRTKADWRKLENAQAVSGKTKKAWCRDEGINYLSYLKRTKALTLSGAEAIPSAERTNVDFRQSKGQVKSGWIEAMAAAPAAQTNQTTEPFRIEIGAFRLTVPERFCEVELSCLLKVLAGCVC